MADIKQQIFSELNALEEAAANALLTEQVRTLRDKNVRATELIDKSISILKKLK